MMYVLRSNSKIHICFYYLFFCYMQEISHRAHFHLILQDCPNALGAISAVKFFMLSTVCIRRGTFYTKYFAHFSFFFTQQAPNEIASSTVFSLSCVILVAAEEISAIRKLI